MPKQIKEEVIEEERTLKSRRHDSWGNYEIYRENGGVVPARLRGIYTTRTLADRSIESHNKTQGLVNEDNQLRSEFKSIQKLDHTYDEV